MKYDKIRGASVAECMMKLRSMYGAAAIILATREVREGGVLGSGLFAKKQYEVDFMLREEEGRSSGRSALSSRLGERPYDAARAAFSEREERRRASVEKALNLARKHAGLDAGAIGSAGGGASATGGTSGAGLRDEDDSEGLAGGRRSSLPARFPRLDSGASDAGAGSDVPATGRAGDESGGLEASRRRRGGNSLERSAAAASAFGDEESDRRAIDLLLASARAGDSSGDSEVGRDSEAGGSGEGRSVRFRDDAHDEPLVAAAPLEAGVGVPTKESAADRSRSRGSSTGPLFSSEPAGRRVDYASDPALQRIGRRMTEEGGFSAEYAAAFLGRLDHSLAPADKQNYRAVEARAIDLLADSIRVQAELAPRSGECRAVFLIGPTGSGKTTSVAKLAARYHIVEQRDVSLYSLDHYRLAATEQLKTYASVMDAPFFSPFTPKEFAECLRRDGAELMLIDTSGIGHRDRARLDQLQEYVEACEVRYEKHLVLAANSSPAMLEKIVLAYDRIGFDKILLTKLDESDFIGAFLELADKFTRPFSFMMNGQDVPGDVLEVGPRELAALALQEDASARGRVLAS